MGDPAGIGPEITLKAWDALRQECSDDFAFAVIAPPDIFKNTDYALIEHLDEIGTAFAKRLPILPIKGQTAIAGKPDPSHATAIIDSIQRAVDLCVKGKAAALITNPIAKAVLYQAGFSHPGHTEYLGHLTENYPAPYERGPLMMLSTHGLRIALVTIHQSIKTAAQSLTQEKIIHHARILHGALQYDLGIANPRIAMAALNPHAGENGAMGDEEQTIINPAAERLRGEGIQITDALPADTMFHAEARAGYDAALCMYHDQGLIPVKTLDFHGAVNTTLGLPIIRTSPDHGTAFSIAGQNIARPDSLISAIKLAREIHKHRTRRKHGA